MVDRTKYEVVNSMQRDFTLDPNFGTGGKARGWEQIVFIVFVVSSPPVFSLYSGFKFRMWRK